MKKLFLVSAMTALFSVAGFAQTYPAKPISLIVPFVAGGPTDRVARDLAEAMRKPLGDATIIIENVLGAGSSIGANKLVKAAPDGYTIMLNHIAMATMPNLLRNMPFKIDSDFEYLGMVNEVPMTVISKPSLPATNYKELVVWLNQNKGKINLGNAGVGSASHLCGLMLQNALQIDMAAIPYKGTAPALTDLIGGQIDILCDQTTNTTPQIEAKKVKVFGVTTSKRLTTAVLKDVPTLQESGLKGFDVSIWHGIYAPKGTPADVVAKLNNALKVALKDPDFIKKQEALGAVIIHDKRVEPAEHKKFVAAEIAKWGPVIAAAKEYID
jgi:tripartite-type tricarboxylate transporter receptor subunit TctC